MYTRLGSVFFALSAFVFAQQAAPDIESVIKPILTTNCAACHNAKNRSSGLALDSRQNILAGGNRGPAATPGSPGNSLLLKAVEQTGDLKMPPGKRLKDEEIAALRRWIESDLPWPAETAQK